MDKLKKVLGFLVFPLLLLMLFLPTGEAHAADVTDKVHLDKLNITVANSGDENIAYVGKSDKSSTLKFSGEFSFPGIRPDELKEGDYFVVDAPSNLVLENATLDLINAEATSEMIR